MAEPFDPSATADAAEAAACAAADVLRGYARDLSRLVLRDKGTNELVSEADVEAQRVLVARLDGVVPGATFLGEEEGLGDASQARDGLRWILDPLDGTTNFTRGVPPYAVSVGLVDGLAPVVGVVYELTSDERFRGVVGDGPGAGLTVNGAAAGVSGTAALPDTLLATGFPYRRFGYQDAYLGVLGSLFGRSRGLRRHGAASVDLAYTAAGRFDGFFEVGLSPWDAAAGLALVVAGGGRVSDFAGGPDALYAGQTLATNGRLHAALLDALAPLRDVHG